MTRVWVALLAAACAWAQGFEVASVRRHELAVDRPLIKNPGADPAHISGSRVTLEIVSLKDLVMAAYGVKDYQVSGGPAWAGRVESLYDVSAKAHGDTALTTEQVRPMLQALLAERFHLRLHRESKQMPVYKLAVSKSGVKMKPAAAGAPPAPGMRRGAIDQLAALLSLMLDRPVIDTTGLAGLFDYPNTLAQLDVGAQDSADTISRTLTAIQEQLGLRAEPTRATLQVLIIEAADPPESN